LVQSLLQYEQEAVLSHGASSTVYLLRSKHNWRRSKRVACRVTSCDTAHSEALPCTNITHAHIIVHLASWLDYSSHSRRLFIFTEYVSGGTLEQRMKHHTATQNPVPSSIILRWLSQLCSALQFVHSHGLMQRDLKPSNIFITER